MKTTITIFKESGKWYNTFEVELPKHLQAWDKVEITRWLNHNKGLIVNNYIFTIDDVPHLIVNKEP